ncbi:MAG: Fur family transcriptional regulator [Candidatus Kaelpia imicola]|nr:Fur family transcriptional regulator [Candidatus Kaelpia imicola]
MLRQNCSRQLWWHGRFRGCGYRLTIPREVLLDVLAKTDKHLSAEEIYFAVNRCYPNIGLATIYRNLELLIQMGLVSKLNIGDSRARYELTQGPKSMHHHHLVCTACGKIIDYRDYIDEEVELLKRVEKGLSKKYGFKISSHFMRFFGLCDKCQKNKETEGGD